MPFVPAPPVMAHLDPADALIAEAVWEHGRDPSVDGVIGELAYRHALGPRSWLDGAIGVEAATTDAADGLSLLDATIGAGVRVGDRAAVRARIGLPSAADGGSAGAAAAAIADLRVDDRAASRPATTSIGAYVDWRANGERARTFVQIEGGAEAWIGGDHDVPALRAGIAGGVRVAAPLWLLAELTTIAFVLDRDPPPPGGDFVHALDLGAAIALPRGALAIRLEVPTDAALRTRDDLAIGVAYRITVDP